MPVITSAYARLAGHQSESTVDTITRVASNEVEYNRQLKQYKKDMMITMGNLNREEKLLRKSRIRYSRKLREIKHERRRREKEDYDREQQRKNNFATVSVDVFLVETSQPEPEPGVKQETETDKLSPNSIQTRNTHLDIITTHDQEEAHNANEENESEKDEDSMDKDNENDLTEKVDGEILSKLLRKRQKNKQGNGELSLPLSAIEEDSEQEKETIREEETSDTHPGKRTPSGNVSRNNSGKRKKKRNVSYSDIIKLQHQSSSRRLFDLVDILAQKHGVKIPRTKIPDTRDNVVLRGSKDSFNLDPFARAGFVLYPMKYGYTSDNLDEQLPTSENQSNSTPHSDRSSSRLAGPSREGFNPTQLTKGARESVDLNFETVSSISPEKSILSGQKIARKELTLPDLSHEVSRIKRDHSRRLTESEYSRRDNIDRKNLISRIGELPPLRHRNIVSVCKQQAKEKMVPWSQAIGLLKGVHSLGDVNF